jgi:hypothetical protein
VLPEAELLAIQVVNLPLLFIGEGMVCASAPGCVAAYEDQAPTSVGFFDSLPFQIHIIFYGLAQVAD